ncbi:MAG: cytidylate kinase-like family protein [Desulfobacterales bacterium]|jgi:cytidylate kinase
MPIIAISRGSYHRAKAVGEKLAQKLGYDCLSRDDIIADLEEFQLPEINLVRNLHDAFSVLERFPNGKERFVAAMRSAILKRFEDDNVVYHGLAGHHFAETVAHALKVRIVADIDDRVEKESRRSGISSQESRRLLLTDDEERRKWCMLLYGIDIHDPINYHLVIKINPLTEDDAVDIIEAAIHRPSFQPTSASRRHMADLSAAAQVRHALFEFPSASVSATDGKVSVALKAPETHKDNIKSRIEGILDKTLSTRDYELKIETYY